MVRARERDAAGALEGGIRLTLVDEGHLQRTRVGVVCRRLDLLEPVRDGDQLARRGAAVQRPEGGLAPACGRFVGRGFRDRDLTTVFVGINDVLELYAQYPVRSEADLAATIAAAAAVFADMTK